MSEVTVAEMEQAQEYQTLLVRGKHFLDECIHNESVRVANREVKAPMSKVPVFEALLDLVDRNQALELKIKDLTKQLAVCQVNYNKVKMREFEMVELHNTIVRLVERYRENHPANSSHIEGISSGSIGTG